MTTFFALYPILFFLSFLQALFEIAREKQPSVIFFDEIDALMSVRKVRTIKFALTACFTLSV